MSKRNGKVQSDAVEQDASAGQTAVIELPIHSCLPGYASDRIDCKLNSRQRVALKVLWSSLSKNGSRFHGGYGSHPDGTVVDNGAGAVRYILDRVADAIEESGRELGEFDLVLR